MVTLSLLLAAAAGCATRRPPLKPPAAHLQSATLAELVTSYNRNANAIRTMTLKLELTAKAGDKKYPRVSAYLLTEKPSSIRIWGTFTLVGRLFDMASNGARFELNLPTRNQFIEGRNNIIPAVTKNPLEKLRPQVILNALLINPIPAADRVALDPSAPATDYQVLVLEPGLDGEQRLARRITFSRLDLLPHAQVIYDQDRLSTHASYGDYTMVDQIPVPQDLTIERPVESYGLRLQVVKGGVKLNQPFTDPSTFELNAPAGSTVLELSDTGSGPVHGGEHRTMPATGQGAGE